MNRSLRAKGRARQRELLVTTLMCVFISGVFDSIAMAWALLFPYFQRTVSIPDLCISFGKHKKQRTISILHQTISMNCVTSNMNDRSRRAAWQASCRRRTYRQQPHPPAFLSEHCSIHPRRMSYEYAPHMPQDSVFLAI